MIQSLLIANRGEIALRILRTCREMGIRTLAVYSDADQDTPVVRQADLAIRLGPAPAQESYLDVEKILAIAVGNGVDAIHPGYGFLSENADFSAACQAAGVRFVGPPPEAIRAMGDKAQAKQRMQQVGVPVIPGYLGEAQDAATLRVEAARVGYPLLLKAVAGGGGRGIRLVERDADLEAALEAAQREAQGHFKDARVMLEKYLPQPHHVEFQVLGDTHGTVLHLYERECSVQRRHQKIIEETPSPTLTPPLRQAMARAAVQAAQAIGYVGAGTVEFLVDETGAFFFMEMNTRLQVEHPVTELTLGLDLVRLQIEVAEGRPLALRQEEVRPSGHAIECRLNAENPAKRFLPSVGRIRRLHFPHGPGLRVDTGFASGAEISPYYDSLLAKLIAWGPHREEALRRMQRLLEGTQCTGIASNLALLQAILAQEEFQAGRYTTRFIERHEAALLRPDAAPGLLREQLLALAAVEALLRREALAAGGNGSGAPSTGPWAGGPLASGRWAENARAASPWTGSPWSGGAAFSTAPGTLPTLALEVELHSTTHALLLHLPPHPDAGAALPLEVTWQGLRQSLAVEPLGEGRALLELEGLRLPLLWDAQGSQRWITLRGVPAVASAQEPAAQAGASLAGGAERLQAPLPGKVLKVAVAAGQQVREGDVLLILEAMKVEHTITAPYAGRVKGLPFKEGDLVQRNDALVQLEPET